jgi:hypothetical protein
LPEIDVKPALNRASVVEKDLGRATLVSAGLGTIHGDALVAVEQAQKGRRVEEAPDLAEDLGVVSCCQHQPGVSAEIVEQATDRSLADTLGVSLQC